MDVFYRYCCILITRYIDFIEFHRFPGKCRVMFCSPNFSLIKNFSEILFSFFFLFFLFFSFFFLSIHTTRHDHVQQLNNATQNIGIVFFSSPSFFRVLLYNITQQKQIEHKYIPILPFPLLKDIRFKSPR
jgi:hypothetical protein